MTQSYQHIAQKWFKPTVGLIAWILLCYTCCTLALRRAMKSYRQAITRYNKKKARLLQTRFQHADIKKDIVAMQKRVHHKITALAAQNQTNMLKHLFDQLVSNNLTITNFKPEAFIRKSWYQKRYIRLAVMGSFYDIHHFLAEIETSALPVAITDCSIEQKKEILTCSFIVKLYIFKS